MIIIIMVCSTSSSMITKTQTLQAIIWAFLGVHTAKVCRKVLQHTTLGSLHSLDILLMAVLVCTHQGNLSPGVLFHLQLSQRTPQDLTQRRHLIQQHQLTQHHQLTQQRQAIR
eukprot:Blabericola_migrator_1__8613@NODE_450_length_8372_cov_59_228898_g352_i0_p7_GENE_NODE_450_length_8372_cov_59_228898_g352_i0NODE_450_length_8372_cov_59_228898_g352_i0_p7_ORF_typecomplete_len113_score4_20DUF2970/PF11174_8/0_015_NODE_450_length_8372_cov_59_228898_g352_i024202758